MNTEKAKKRHKEELTLRLDGALITPEEFKTAARAFADLLLHVTEAISYDAKKPTWSISVRTGSSIFVATPLPDIETGQRAKETIRALREGLALIEKGKIDVPHFNNQALYAARDLASLKAKPGRAGLTVIEIGNGSGKACPITTKAADFLNKNLGGQRHAYGSIEGKLQTISDRGTFQFVVFDALTDRGVNCFVPQDKFKEAHIAFGRRVSVAGEIHYDRDGKPLSIRVSGIRVFKDLNELPPIDDFCGILQPI